MRTRLSSIKKLACLVPFIFILSACATTTIHQVEKKWGPPAKVENIDSKNIYYWHFYRGSDWGFGKYSEGWVTYEITADNNGTILNKRKYWRQPNSN